MKPVLLFGLFIVFYRPALAQIDSVQFDSVRSVPTNVVRRNHPEFDEEILYYGKRNQYFSVRIFRKNGDFFRLDSYEVLPKTLPNGFQLDSVSRIVHQGPTKIVYPSGRPYVNCEYKNNALHGPFIVLYEDGSVKRREFYRFGRMTRSKCYTPEGSEQACESFYQLAQFQGKSEDLQAYLKKKLESMLDGDRVRRVAAALTINEIGQITRINVAVTTAPSAEEQVPIVGSYLQQVLRNMPEWVPDKLNWKPAVNDGVNVSSTCIVTLFRYAGRLQCSVSFRM